MSEDNKPDLKEFMENLAKVAQQKMGEDAALGRQLRGLYGGELLAALQDPDPMAFVFFCTRQLVGHTIAHSHSGTVIACTDFAANGKPAGDWQVVIAPYDEELQALARENQGAKPDGTVH